MYADDILLYLSDQNSSLSATFKNVWIMQDSQYIGQNLHGFPWIGSHTSLFVPYLDIR